MAQNLKPFTIENARIGFRNFAGEEGQFNRKGDRNFALFLTDADAQAMDADGWNVKLLKPREEGDAPQPYIQVKVNYASSRPPRITLVTSRGRNKLEESDVSMMDWVDIVNVDLIVAPYEWEVGDKRGISAYLQTMFVTIEEDDLERKYAEIPTSNGSDV